MIGIIKEYNYFNYIYIWYKNVVETQWEIIILKEIKLS